MDIGVQTLICGRGDWLCCALGRNRQGMKGYGRRLPVVRFERGIGDAVKKYCGVRRRERGPGWVGKLGEIDRIGYNISDHIFSERQPHNSKTFVCQTTYIL